MYPGNHTESEILSVPRNLKTRPGAPETHLAYITDDEADLLETPHRGPHDIANYDSFDWDPGGAGGGSFTGGSDVATSTYSTGSGGSQPSEDYWEPPSSPVDTYTPPQEYYGPTQTGVIPGQTSYNWQGIDPNNAAHEGVWSTVQNMFKSGSGMRTLEFYGIVKKDPNTGKYYWTQESNQGKQLPVEFINQIAEGSIVSGPEAVKGYGLVDEPFTGTWDDITGGDHPMFPGGVQDYYTATQEPFIVPYTGGRGGGRGGRGGGYYGGRGGGSGGGRGSGGGSRMQFPGAEGAYMRSRWGQPTIQGDYIRRMRGYNRGGIASLC